MGTECYNGLTIFYSGGHLVTELTEQQREQARVDAVIKEIDRQIEGAKQALAAAHQETRAVEQNYSENASINRYEIDDIAESRSEIEQQRQLVARASENETILVHQLDTLKQLRAQPYFGRIDIQDPGQAEAESLYIGTASLMNEARTDFLIYDWRAPIAGVYYNGTLGPVTYQTPAGTQRTTLVKKRQFTIHNGQIENMFDTNETVGDAMLQAALGRQNDQAMQNIVATIQKEQNDIIRNTTADLMVVQGVAGSGKTSAILQRIAYLLYHARESLNADQIVLFSPNLLFSHYIASVLPSLGERNMRQVTLPNFLARRFEGLQVESLFDRYETRQQSNAPHPLADWLEGAASMAAVKDYVDQLANSQASLQFADLTFEGRTLFTKEAIASIYHHQVAKMTVADRLVKVKNALLRRLQHLATTEAKRDWVAKELDTLSNQELHALYGQKTIDDFADEQAQAAYLARRWAKKRLRVVADAIYNNYFLDFHALYRQFLLHLPLTGPITEAVQQQLATDFSHGVEFHRIKLVHTAPFLYLRDLLTGGGQNRSFQYVFIDEMQDYSLATLIYLKHAFPDAKFTVIGDAEQALFKPLELPETLLNRVGDALAAKHPRLIALRRSYRSTFEITTFAKSLLPDGDKITAFARHGDPANLQVHYGQAAWQNGLIKAVQAMQQRFPTVAVLTRDQEEASQVYHHLYGQVTDLHRLSEEDSQLPSGVLILPIYLAKGLEFDGVVIANVSAAHLGDQATGLLYTMATRAMHALTMLTLGPVTPALTGAASQYLTIDHPTEPQR